MLRDLRTTRNQNDIVTNPDIDQHDVYRCLLSIASIYLLSIGEAEGDLDLYSMIGIQC
jgi:hypothetical protein